MKLSVVIAIPPGSAALKLAVKTQGLLIERMGARLNSIRLAVPRLLSLACLGAIKDAPDLLAVVGGPRASRRAGEIAHRKNVPILFLPGIRRAAWASALWRELSLDDMIAALSREDLSLVTLGAGSAGGRIFFGGARSGVMPYLAGARRNLAEAEILQEAWAAIYGAGAAAKRIFKPCFGTLADGAVERRAEILDIRPPAVMASLSGVADVRPLPFHCMTWSHGGVFDYTGHIVCALRIATGEEIAPMIRGSPDRFDCGRLLMQGPEPALLVLDGEPAALKGPVEFTYLPSAVKTFAFNPAPFFLKDAVLLKRVQRVPGGNPALVWDVPILDIAHKPNQKVRIC